MTETASNVYDLVYPSPATLKEISCNALITGLWHWEVDNRKIDDYYEFISELNLCKNLDAYIPSSIKLIIDAYIDKFMTSMDKWSGYHCENLLHIHLDDENCILHDFYDFSTCERDGTIHYIRTAKRLMTCDLFSNNEKFKIACMYCFEDDIRRIWPSVSEEFYLEDIDFDAYPQLFYWICVLRNELDRIPNPEDDPIDVVMLRVSPSPSHHWSSVVYFWNRICPENQLDEALNLYEEDEVSLVRFILPKLSDEVLNKFVAAKGGDLIYNLFITSYGKSCVLPTWMYFRNKMSEVGFINLMVLFMCYETKDYYIVENALNENSVQLGVRSSNEDETYLCCEMWRNSPDELKRSAIRSILSKDHVFSKPDTIPPKFRETRFLLTVLLDASIKERNTFWHKNWRYLIVGTRGKDLHRIMELCFRYEADIAKFKDTMIVCRDDVARICVYCMPLLEHGYFKETDDYLIFCCPETWRRKLLKQLILRMVFFDRNFSLTFRHLLELESMNEFIKDAFEDADIELATEFNNDLVLACTNKDLLRQCIDCGENFSSRYLIRFIDILVQTEEVRITLKKNIMNYVKDFLINGDITNVSVDDLQTIVLWCLGNDDEVINFKRSLSIDDVFSRVRDEVNLSEVKTRIPAFGEFLKWYFRTPEEIDKFERQFSSICDSPVSDDDL
ncbi:uncharacterized protein LOC135834500 isoform X3 [Planococcus citri]|uniref:uncharacterized protein LOC135834500 isoform X3 n=1 Tax=Planococcus citri TaxID=170843 RepID=UPI0031F95853